jgi:hypothetical protein
MAKKVKIWIGKPMDGGDVKRRTLKGLCEAIGLSYSTAKKGQDKGGDKKVWVISGKVWMVWTEDVE